MTTGLFIVLGVLWASWVLAEICSERESTDQIDLMLHQISMGNFQDKEKGPPQ